jgi:alpha-methylacyl-CoA racemase
MEQIDVCYAPVLNMRESMEHPHNVHRGTFIDVGGVKQPGPAPRFERTPSNTPQVGAYAGEHSKNALADWGFAVSDIDALLASGAAKQR